MTDIFPPVLPGMAELAQLPAAHQTARYRLLAEYLNGRKDRAQTLGGVCRRLDPDGRITDATRAHVVEDRRPFRRMVLRGAMIALGLPLPAWLYETAAVWTANRDWLAEFAAKRAEEWRGSIPVAGLGMAA